MCRVLAASKALLQQTPAGKQGFSAAETESKMYEISSTPVAISFTNQRDDQCDVLSSLI
jgi:hypothetical protein